MSEQLLTVIGTLGAAPLGFIGIIFTNHQNNRHQTELQEKRYEQEEAARTREKKLELLDELCSLILKLNKGKSVYLERKDEKGEPIFPLAETINRVTVIVLLYFDDLQHLCFDYLKAHKTLQDIYYEVNKIATNPDGHGITAEKAKELQAQLPIARKNFEVAFTNFLPEIKIETEKIYDSLREIEIKRRKKRRFIFFQRIILRFRRMIFLIQVWQRKRELKSHKKDVLNSDTLD